MCLRVVNGVPLHPLSQCSQKGHSQVWVGFCFLLSVGLLICCCVVFLWNKISLCSLVSLPALPQPPRCVDDKFVPSCYASLLIFVPSCPTKVLKKVTSFFLISVRIEAENSRAEQTESPRWDRASSLCGRCRLLRDWGALRFEIGRVGFSRIASPFLTSPWLQLSGWMVDVTVCGGHSQWASDAPKSRTSRVMDLDRLRWKWPEAWPRQFLHNRTA